MHHFHPSAGDVIAVTLEDRIGSGDMEAILDRIEEALARYPQLHVFVETRSLDSLELAGFGDSLARAMPLMKELRRFGRVAVVADQALVRAGTRLESALLPFVSYRVFKPDERARAMAWVTGG